MASCPFCHGEIPESVALHGGTCPHCFADVPGEEAATDPGEHLKAQHRAEDKARAEKSARRPLLVAAPLALGVVGAIAFVVYTQVTAPKIERLDFSDKDFAFEIDLATYVEPPPAPEGRPVAQPQQQRASVLGAGGLTGPREGVAEQLASAQQASGGAGGRVRTGSAENPGEPRAVEGPGLMAAGGSNGDVDISFAASRSGAVLVSREDLQAAVRDLFRTRSGRLQHCYEKSLKGNESLSGTWRLSFTLDEQGAATDASAEGQQSKDPAFEACLAAELSSWRVLGKLEKPWPVSLPVAFKK